MTIPKNQPIIKVAVYRFGMNRQEIQSYAQDLNAIILSLRPSDKLTRDIALIQQFVAMMYVKWEDAGLQSAIKTEISILLGKFQHEKPNR